MGRRKIMLMRQTVGWIKVDKIWIVMTWKTRRILEDWDLGSLSITNQMELIKRCNVEDKKRVEEKARSISKEKIQEYIVIHRSK
jgi:hypothetical protein